MTTKIQKWGNSQGFRVSKDILEEIHAAVGDTVKVSVQKGAILVRPIRRSRRRHDIRRLLSRMPKNYKPSAEVWGKPLGAEVW